MTQQLKAGTAPPEDPSLIPRAHNGQFTPPVSAAPGTPLQNTTVMWHALTHEKGGEVCF